MVFTSAVRGGWSRRAVLTAAGSVGIAGALSGCSLSREPEPPPPDPLAPLLVATRALAERYQRALAALSADSESVATLTPLHEAQLAHEEALAALIGAAALGGSPTSSPRVGGWATPVDPGPAATADPVEIDPGQIFAELREAEEQAQAEATEACLSAPPERAALLGSIAAARATHLAVLA